MGGRPIRGNEWLSTTGRSACTVCHVEMRFSFERGKLTIEFTCVSLLVILVPFDFFLSSYKSLNVKQRLSSVKGPLLCHAVKIRLGRVIIIVKHHQASCHAWTCVLLAPQHFGYLQTDLGDFSSPFQGSVLIISPGFHHLFPESPILLNWHLNIC